MNISVIGAGQMGNGIAHVFAQSGHSVTLIDIAQASLDKGLATIGKNLDRQVAKGSITEEQKLATLKNIAGSTDMAAGVRAAELVVEAGETTACEADLGEAGSMAVEVRVVDREGGLAVRPRAAVIDRAEAAEDLKALLRSRFERSFQADCGEAGPEVIEPEETFVCRARDADGRRSVRVTVTDVAGTLSFEVLDET